MFNYKHSRILFAVATLIAFQACNAPKSAQQSKSNSSAPSVASPSAPSNPSSPSQPVNSAPVANAGSDQTVVLPNSTAVLNGSGSDSDGSIVSYSWSKVSGPAATLSGASSASLSLSGLVSGSYVFRLTITDDDGATSSDQVAVAVQSSNTINTPVNGAISNPTTLNHFVHFPPGYDANNPNLKFPLLIAMHGIGERGDASKVDINGNPYLDMTILNNIKKNGMPAALIEANNFKDASGNQYPFIVVSPQLRSGDGDWYGSRLTNLLDYAVQKYHVDENKVYFMGLSLGGRGAWTALNSLSSRTAAIVVASGRSIQSINCKNPDGSFNAYRESIKNKGVWAFHGSTDTLNGVSYNEGANSISQFNQCSPNVVAKFSTYIGYGHVGFTWTNTFNNNFKNQADSVMSSSERSNIGADGLVYQDIYRWLLTFSLN